MTNPTDTPLDTQNEPTAFLEASRPLSLEAEANQRFAGLLNAYLRFRDPTEYCFAKQHFGTWAAWKAFSEKEEIRPVIGQWREELTVKLRYESLARILEAAQGETRDALSANKYIYETLAEDKGKVGRPSKEAISKEAYKLHEDSKLREEAYNRIFTPTSSFLSTEDTTSKETL